MRTLAQTLNRRIIKKYDKVDFAYPLHHTLMGVEMEVECSTLIGETRLPREVSLQWSVKGDGSLSDGLEYVLAVPLSGDALASAVHTFFDVVKPGRASTSSTHIHINMLDEESDIATVQRMVLIAYVLEEAIFHMADPGREYCGYCTKLSQAPELLLRDMLNPTLDEPQFLKNIKNSSIGRYYGLNTQALGKYGTVEFRYFPTASSEAELNDWISLVQSFKLAALNTASLAELGEIFTNEQNYVAFIRKFFDKWADQILESVSFVVAKNNYNAAVITSMLHKANSPIVFNKDKVSTKFKKLRARKTKVAKKAATPMRRIIVLEPAASVPVAREHAEGTIMLSTHGIYIDRLGEDRHSYWYTIHDVGAAHIPDDIHEYDSVVQTTVADWLAEHPTLGTAANNMLYFWGLFKNDAINCKNAMKALGDDGISLNYMSATYADANGTVLAFSNDAPVMQDADDNYYEYADDEENE